MAGKTDFAKRIRWRIRVLWALIVLMLVYMVVVGETGGGDSRMQTDLAENMSRILFFGGLIWAGWRIRQNRRILSDIRLLKAQAVAERDEFTRHLHLQSGGWVMDAMLLILYVVTMTASMYSMPLFHLSLGLLLTAIALKAGAWWMARRVW